MKFVTIREFRNSTAAVRKDLETEREIVLTANVVSPAEFLHLLRQAPFGKLRAGP